MPDQLPLLEQQGQVETPSAEPQSEEQVSIRRLRQERADDQPRSASRRPYAHGNDAPFESESDRWGKPSEPETGKGGFQRRIDRLTREKANLERQLAEARTGQAPTPAAPQPTQSAPPPQPTVEQPAPSSQNHQDPGIENLTPEQQQEWQRQHHAKRATFVQRYQAATQSDPEFAEAVRGGSHAIPLPMSVVTPALVEMGNGPEVAIYLAKHPDVQRRITMMWQASGDAVWNATRNPTAAQQAAGLAVIRELHGISTALHYGTALPSSTRRVIERPVSQAPTPITPVSGGQSARHDIDEEGEDVDIMAYRKRRPYNPRRG